MTAVADAPPKDDTTTTPEKPKRAPRKKTTAPAQKKTAGKKGAMSAQHKTALAEGREQARAVNAYLEALEAHKPKRGRKVTKESLEQRLQKVRDEIPNATAGERLLLFSQEIELQDRLENFSDETFDIEPLQVKFIEVAKPYAERRGIQKKAFAKMGVPTDVLKSAGF